jgi:TolA-binding protein
LKKRNNKKYWIFLLIFFSFVYGCNYVTHKTVEKETLEGDDDPEPVYDITLNPDYQDYITYMFMGNRSEEFGTFFNKFYQALEDYDEALTDYRASTISAYNRRLDSLNITPPISAVAKEKLNKVLERCSKIIQYNKSTRFIDDAVLLIGKSYYYMGEYLQSERKFSEFLSKLTKSNLYDEAILFLGKTKLKLGKYSDAEVILSNLFKTTKDNEIKSEITQDLAVLSIVKNNYQDAIDYFKKSIEFTKDKDKKAEKQYILAKIYSKTNPEIAYLEYRKSYELASDFELLFYSKLNEAKSLNEIGKTNDAYQILDKLSGKYRDYLDLKQLVELEIGNTFYSQKKYKEARTKYFDVILEYPGSKVAADAYYHLADYSENIKDNYLYAYVNYKKVSETNPASDYANISTKKTTILDKYFSLLATIKDTTKIVYPENEPDFINHKEIKEKEKGDENRGNEFKGSENPQQKPKGSGYSGFGLILDSLENPEGSEVKDTLELIKKNNDTLSVKNNIVDTNIVKIQNDSITQKNEIQVKKLSPEDSLLLVIHREDSIKTVKELNKIDAYFQLSELFLYDLNKIDSALFYLNKIISDSINPERTSKAMYSVATIYKNQGEDLKAKEIFEKIISVYPNTLFANEARKILGLQLKDISVDSAEVYYSSAEKKILSNNYESALSDLRSIITRFPSDSFYLKTLYSIGWIYEYGFKNKDSSASYYKKIKKDFPNSPYAQSVTPKLDFYDFIDKRDTTKSLDSLLLSLDSLKKNPDSTGTNLNQEKIKDVQKENEGSPKKEKQSENSGDESPLIKSQEEKKK